MCSFVIKFALSFLHFTFDYDELSLTDQSEHKDAKKNRD